MDLIDKRKSLLLLQHIAEEMQVGDGGRRIPDAGTDLFKPLLPGMAADRVIVAVRIVVEGHGLPETVEWDMIRLCQVVRMTDIGQVAVDHEVADGVQAHAFRQPVKVFDPVGRVIDIAGCYPVMGAWSKDGCPY